MFSMVPVTALDPAMAGAVLEAISAYSHFGNDAMYSLASAPSLTVASHLESIRDAADTELSRITGKLTEN